jgi:hypothetical protein
MSRHFSTPKPPKPPATPAPIVDTSAADEAAGKAKRQAKLKRGRASTILTSPVGAPLGGGPGSLGGGMQPA